MKSGVIIHASGEKPAPCWGVANGILTVCAATVVMALGFGALGLTSVFMGALEAHFAWTRTDTSLIYGVATIGMAIGGAIWGRLSDRIDQRILLIIGGVGMSAAILLMAAANSLWQFYAANVVLGGLGFSVLYAPALAASGEWFPDHRGLVTGIVTAGGALGQGVVPFTAAFLIDNLGWRFAYLGIAVVVLFAMAAVLPFLRRPVPPAEAASMVTLADSGISRSGNQRVALLAAAAFFCCACMGMPLVHLASFIGSVCGSANLGATSLLVAMVFGAAGRVSFGFLADRIGPLASYAAASATQTVCVAAYPMLGDGLSLLGLSAVFGFGFAGNMTCLVLCVRTFVPAGQFGGAIGLVMLVAWAGMAVGGYAGGWLFDVFFSYVAAFALAATAGLLNLLVLLALAFQVKRQEQSFA